MVVRWVHDIVVRVKEVRRRRVQRVVRYVTHRHDGSVVHHCERLRRRERRRRRRRRWRRRRRRRREKRGAAAKRQQLFLEAVSRQVDVTADVDAGVVWVCALFFISLALATSFCLQGSYARPRGRKRTKREGGQGKIRQESKMAPRPLGGFEGPRKREKERSCPFLCVCWDAKRSRPVCDWSSAQYKKSALLSSISRYAI